MGTANKRVVIAGGIGFVGTYLAGFLTARSYDVVTLSRHAPQHELPGTHRLWDGRTLGDWQSVVDGADAIVNLAGHSVDCIKTPENQDEILRSRVDSTRVIGEATRSANRPPRLWVQMSTAHIYGDSLSATCNEDSATGYGFAPFVGYAWEQAFGKAKPTETRGVVLRTSFVLGRDRGAGGGPLGRLVRLTKLGLGGTIGSGKQGLSWIHELDLARLVADAIENDNMNGVYIASSPHPVSQQEFARALRRSMGVPVGLPATETMVRLGAHWLLRTDAELALYGRYVVSKRLADMGFQFEYPRLADALAELTDKSVTTATTIRPSQTAR